jgi:hypothetical protein
VGAKEILRPRLVVRKFDDAPRQADLIPSNVPVPRVISSRITRLRCVALLRMLAVSLISTMNPVPAFRSCRKLVGRELTGVPTSYFFAATMDLRWNRHSRVRLGQTEREEPCATGLAIRIWMLLPIRITSKDYAPLEHVLIGPEGDERAVTAA